ncbi:MAG TPA: isoprenylcysteine carboxylmethyltransferase family protein [Acidobacteriaceae bacterium]
MKNTAAALGTTVFFFVAPGVVAGVVPWWMNRWRFSSPAWDPPPVRSVGVALTVIGVVALVECFARFATRGRGTPAPAMPTETLVVSGLYRYVRNPMYLAVFAVIVGQWMLFGDRGTLLYAACVGVAFALFVMLYEEPTLRRRYGAQYEEYCSHVRRWWPRLQAWNGSR